MDALVERYYPNPEDYFERPPANINDSKDTPDNENDSRDASQGDNSGKTENGTLQEEYLSKDQNVVISQQTNKEDVKPTESEQNDSNKLFLQDKKEHILISKPYSDYLIDGVPIWQKENRGMTEEEAEAFKDEVARVSKSK